MTLDELIETLTDLRDAEEVPGDTEVSVLFQPNYPLKGMLKGVTTAKLVAAHDYEADEEENGREDDDMTKEEVVKEVEEVVYLVSGEGTEYGDASAWSAIQR